MGNEDACLLRSQTLVGLVNSEHESFSATRWSVVLAAEEESPDALTALCRAYWYPLYAFLRRQGLSTPDAEDVTQGFFAHLLEKDALTKVDRTKGRFRTFLLASLKHFLADERDRANAQKRGGGRAVISLDACEAEERYALEPQIGLHHVWITAAGRSLLAKSATLSRLRQFLSLALLMVVPFSLFLFLQQWWEDAKWADRPELRKLAYAADDYANAQSTMTTIFPSIFPPRTREALEWKSVQHANYISEHFGEFVASSQFDSNPVSGKWSQERRDQVRAVVRPERGWHDDLAGRRLVPQ